MDASAQGKIDYAEDALNPPFNLSSMRSLNRLQEEFAIRKDKPQKILADWIRLTLMTTRTFEVMVKFLVRNQKEALWGNSLQVKE